MRPFASILVVLFALGLGLAAGRWYFLAPARRDNAGVPAPQPKRQSPSPSPAAPQLPPPADVAFMPPVYDFGSLLEGQARTCTLEIDRSAGTALKLGRVYSTSPCIAMSVGQVLFTDPGCPGCPFFDVPAVAALNPKYEFAPDEPAAVNVTLSSWNLEGKKSFPVFAEVLEPAQGTLLANVTADVKHVPAKITLVPDTIHFGAAHGARSASVKLLNLTHQQLSLSVKDCSLKDVTVSILEGDTIAPGQTATIFAEMPFAGLPPGPIQGLVILQTSCAGQTQIMIAIDGTSLPASD